MDIVDDKVQDDFLNQFEEDDCMQCKPEETDNPTLRHWPTPSNTVIFDGGVLSKGTAEIINEENIEKIKKLTARVEELEAALRATTEAVNEEQQLEELSDLKLAYWKLEGKYNELKNELEGYEGIKSELIPFYTPSGLSVEKAVVTYVQDPDTMSSEDDYQNITIETQAVDDGAYFDIKINGKWSVNNGSEISMLVDDMKKRFNIKTDD